MHIVYDQSTQLALDLSNGGFGPQDIQKLAPSFGGAIAAMRELEGGAIANPDEKRMVGHYWLRTPELAPTEEIRQAIEQSVADIATFAGRIHRGEIVGSTGKTFASILLVGIGGSALGPQLVNAALSAPKNRLELFCFDNTDPDGMELTLRRIPDLSATLVLVISKSGGTKETRNGMLVAEHALKLAGLTPAKQMVAVTMAGSELDRYATAQGWLARFPMFDWIGGRTSELSAVGLLPAALQGFDIGEMLRGAREMDASTRNPDLSANLAGLLASAWYLIGGGKGTKDMVVLPYKDRLELMSRYLQQLVMESLGKEKNLKGEVVHQGISVFGNKGSTDQHAYVQQLRDGLNNFFALFIEVLRDDVPRTFGGSVKEERSPVAFREVEPGVTSGDFLAGFFLGTRRALSESGRANLTVTVPEVSEYTVGALIALFERAVGFYATMIGINAYHQPGVEAGKKAAADVLALQLKLQHLVREAKQPLTAQDLASKLGSDAETVLKIVTRLVANKKLAREGAPYSSTARYSVI